MHKEKKLQSLADCCAARRIKHQKVRSYWEIVNLGVVITITHHTVVDYFPLTAQHNTTQIALLLLWGAIKCQN